MNRIRAVSKLISGRLGLGDLDGFVQEDKAYERAKSIVPFFYYFLLFIALLQLLQLRHLAEPLIFAPRWPIFWADYMSFHAATTVILVFFAFPALKLHQRVPFFGTVLTSWYTSWHSEHCSS